MDALKDAMLLVDALIGGADWFVYLLLGTGLFFTVYLGFPQIRYFRHALKIVAGKFDRSGDDGDTSHFQALATALSGTVGTGNIAGVAFAIHLGGPAALFWMVVTAFLGMTTKFVEVTLSHKYREKTPDGTMAGGPMYFMKKRLKMPWLAVIFAVATIFSSFGTGSLPQINSIATSMNATFGLNQMLVGGVLSVLLGLVIIGGIKRIAGVTSRLVPIMALIYFVGALGVIVANYQNIIPSIMAIGGTLFSGTAATGGFLGASVAFAFNRGVNRGLFSNEAGQGSAPIAHAAARASEPVSEGIVAILEPFIDTIVICSLTGLVLLSSGVWKDKHQNTFQEADLQVLNSYYPEATHTNKLAAHIAGTQTLPLFSGQLQVTNGQPDTNHTLLHARSVAEQVVFSENDKPFNGMVKITDGKIADEGRFVITGKSLVHSAPLTAIAFEKGIFGKYGQYIVSIGLLLFAFSTAISWSYYGDRAVTFLGGPKFIVPYRIVFILGFFLASFTDTTLIWIFSGITIALMTIPNLIGILLLHKEMKTTIAEYWDDFKKEWGK